MHSVLKICDVGIKLSSFQDFVNLTLFGGVVGG